MGNETNATPLMALSLTLKAHSVGKLAPLKTLRAKAAPAAAAKPKAHRVNAGPLFPAKGGAAPWAFFFSHVRCI